MAAKFVFGNQPPDLANLCLAISERAPLPMATVEGATRIIVYANPAFGRLMEEPAEQLAGKTLYELLPAKNECVLLLDRVFQTGKPATHIEQKKGSPHPIFWSYTVWPVRESEGLVGIMIQVTEDAPAPGKMVAMNEALLLGSVRQHELAEASENLNELLRAEIAEREQVEAALRESDERFRALFELGPVAVYSCDASGVIREFNRRAVELWGRAPTLGETDEKFCGSLRLFRRDGSFLPHEVCPMAEVVFGRKLAEHDAEVIIERPDRSRVTVVVNIRPLKNDRGEITGAINCFYDISERKRAEDALRESETRYRALFNSIDEGFCVIEKVDGPADGPPDFLYVEANPAFGTQSGMVGMVGKTLEQMLPDEAEGWCAIYDTVLKTGHPVRFERGLVTHGRELELYAFRIEDVTHRRVAVIFKDISERRRVEEALRESEERFRGLFAAAPMAVFVCDRNAVIQHYNERAVELWGRAPVCGAEKHCGSVKLWLQDGTLLLHEESPIVEVMRTGVPARNVEVDIERPDGSRLPVIVNFAAFRDAQGEITGAIAAFMDITERRELEDSLVARAVDLARADRSKDEFLAMLAHELRNPLAPLRNSAEILQHTDATAGERTQAQKILARQIENMTRMIDDLLDVSRITEGKIELRPQIVTLEAIVNAAVSQTRPGIEGRSQNLAISLPVEPIFLHADATRLEQVLANLLGNACKYSNVGSRISVSAERVVFSGKAPPEVIVRVRDDGIGIAPELLPRIFDLFVQATRAPDRAQGGLGIGLTLVHRLVKMHGGSVEARSDGLGHGSEFILRLPILATPADAPASPAAPPPPEAPRRILIVDDNEDSARSMATLQRLRGHQTRIAFTGPDALAIVTEFAPEVVLLDIGLPGMDGYEVARRLRTRPELEGVFLVAMSGYGNPEDRAKAMTAGFDEYMVKPVDLVLFRTWLRSRD